MTLLTDHSLNMRMTLITDCSLNMRMTLPTDHSLNMRMTLLTDHSLMGRWLYLFLWAVGCVLCWSGVLFSIGGRNSFFIPTIYDRPIPPQCIHLAFLPWRHYISHVCLRLKMPQQEYRIYLHILLPKHTVYFHKQIKKSQPSRSMGVHILTSCQFQQIYPNSLKTMITPYKPAYRGTSADSADVPGSALPLWCQ